MCVTAHPDDESGAFGGTLRLYGDRGVETFVLCVTPGQAASHRGTAGSDEELAALRRKEFEAACAILRVTRGLVLDLPDRGLYRVDLFPAVGEVVRHIRQFRPQVLITFGPEGGVTAHPDHSMAAIMATLAYQWAGRPTLFDDQFQEGLRPHRIQKLYYLTADFTLSEREPVSLPPITAEIEVGPYLETKLAAFHAHTTQAPLFRPFGNLTERGGTKELFHLAASIHQGPVQRETDLFAGVRETDDLT